MTQFPVGGPREPVYSFLRQHGFVESKWSDKEWHRADGIRINVYGAGSMARIHDGEGRLIADMPIKDAVIKVRI